MNRGLISFFADFPSNDSGTKQKRDDFDHAHGFSKEDNRQGYAKDLSDSGDNGKSEGAEFLQELEEEDLS